MVETNQWARYVDWCGKYVNFGESIDRATVLYVSNAIVSALSTCQAHIPWILPTLKLTLPSADGTPHRFKTRADTGRLKNFLAKMVESKSFKLYAKSATKSPLAIFGNGDGADGAAEPKAKAKSKAAAKKLSKLGADIINAYVRGEADGVRPTLLIDDLSNALCVCVEDIPPEKIKEDEIEIVMVLCAEFACFGEVTVFVVKKLPKPKKEDLKILKKDSAELASAPTGPTGTEPVEQAKKITQYSAFRKHVQKTLEDAHADVRKDLLQNESANDKVTKKPNRKAQASSKEEGAVSSEDDDSEDASDEPNVGVASVVKKIQAIDKFNDKFQDMCNTCCVDDSLLEKDDMLKFLHPPLVKCTGIVWQKLHKSNGEVNEEMIPDTNDTQFGDAVAHDVLKFLAQVVFTALDPAIVSVVASLYSVSKMQEEPDMNTLIAQSPGILEIVKKNWDSVSCMEKFLQLRPRYMLQLLQEVQTALAHKESVVNYFARAAAIVRQNLAVIAGADALKSTSNEFQLFWVCTCQHAQRLGALEQPDTMSDEMWVAHHRALLAKYSKHSLGALKEHYRTSGAEAAAAQLVAASAGPDAKHAPSLKKDFINEIAEYEWCEAKTRHQDQTQKWESRLAEFLEIVQAETHTVISASSHVESVEVALSSQKKESVDSSANTPNKNEKSEKSASTPAPDAFVPMFAEPQAQYNSNPQFQEQHHLFEILSSLNAFYAGVVFRYCNIT